MSRSLLFVALLLCLTGCGFTPLYGDNNGASGGINSLVNLAEIKIDEEIPAKLTFVFKNEMNSLFPKQKNYKYNLNVVLNKQEQGFSTQNNTENLRTSITLIAKISLKDNKDNIIVEDNIYGYDSFNSKVSPYSNLVARESSQQKLAKQVAQQIAVRVASEINVYHDIAK